MANAINDIIALGKRLEEAQAKVERADSLDQACRESESRLHALRLEEREVRATVEAGRERARQLEEGAKVQAEAILASASARLNEGRREFEAKYRTAVERVEALLAEKTAAVEKADFRLAELESEETCLAQSVTALKAELDALRARVLG